MNGRPRKERVAEIRALISSIDDRSDMEWLGGDDIRDLLAELDAVTAELVALREHDDGVTSELGYAVMNCQVARDETLKAEDERDALRELGQAVWDSIPSDFGGPESAQHAVHLVTLGKHLAATAPGDGVPA